VIGDPIGHSWSPKIHAAAYAHLGLDHKYEAIQVPLEEFDEALAGLAEKGYRGLNVTLPLKILAYNWATPDEASIAYGALNTLDLRTKQGTNTDAPGFLDTLSDLGVEKGTEILLIGAGGTAMALGLALVRAGFDVRVTNRTPAKAEELAIRIGAKFQTDLNLGSAKVILNTTSSGISGEKLPIDWTQAGPKMLAYDAMYQTDPTPFLADAQAAGCRVTDGRRMLVAQAARSFEYWLGSEAPRDVMLSALG
jgi:shikimate dehydrogenase